MVVLLYITPVLVSWSQDPYPDHFQDGHFASLAGRLGGQALVVAMVVGSIISNVGQLNANSMAGQLISHHVVDQNNTDIWFDLLQVNAYHTT